MLSEKELRVIEKRESKATPGPWEWVGAGYEDEFVKLDSSTAEVVHPDRDGFLLVINDDADFIAHAREDTPALLAHIAELEPDAEVGTAVRLIPRGEGLWHNKYGEDSWSQMYRQEDGEYDWYDRAATPEAALEAARKGET